MNRYKVNIDAAPEKRWIHIIKDYKEVILEVIDSTTSGIDDNESNDLRELSNAVLKMLPQLDIHGKTTQYVVEMESIALELGVATEDVCLLHLMYELEAGCTSMIVHPTGTVSPYLARTLDWNLPQLKDMCIEVDFMTNGKVLATVTTFAGYIGVFTGLRIESYGFAINFRGPENDIHNDDKEVFSPPALSWPIGMLIRRIIDTVDSFDEALNIIIKSNLIAPCYVTLVGKQRALTLTRKECSVLHRQEITQTSLETVHNPVIQTNLDYNVTDVDLDSSISIPRRLETNRLWNETYSRYNHHDKDYNVDIEDRIIDMLWYSIAGALTWDDQTIHGTIMCVSPMVYESRLNPLTQNTNNNYTYYYYRKYISCYKENFVIYLLFPLALMIIAMLINSVLFHSLNEI